MKSSHYGFRPVAVENGAEVIPLLNDSVDAILLDINMPIMNGLECLKELNELGNKIPVIILSSDHEAEIAMQAVKLGALDYLTKPFDLDDLFTSLRNAKKISAIQQENSQLKEHLKDSISDSSGKINLVAQAPAIVKIQKQALKIAKLNSTILLTGESGTGKSVFARFIHAHSDRADKPFVTVSCPALPRELLESELFGHEKGAFTGAIKKRIGKIEAAAGGTLFLDEIGDLPIDLQPKLLNVLQDQEFSRVGGEKTIKSDVRIITATNVNLEEKIERKEFREDLFYRISVIPLELPSLRQQIENIIPLSLHFLNRISNARNTSIYTLSPEAQDALTSYLWPGNIRQLENLMREHRHSVKIIPFTVMTSLMRSQNLINQHHSCPAWLVTHWQKSKQRLSSRH